MIQCSSFTDVVSVYAEHEKIVSVPALRLCVGTPLVGKSFSRWTHSAEQRNSLSFCTTELMNVNLIFCSLPGCFCACQHLLLQDANLLLYLSCFLFQTRKCSPLARTLELTLMLSSLFAYHGNQDICKMYYGTL